MADPKLVRIQRNKSGIVQDCDVYIGRAINYGGWNLPQSKWHNPYKISQYESVEQVCNMYFKYIINSELFHDIPELAGKTLGCWCTHTNQTSFYCHGCILIQLFKIIKYHNFDTRMVQQVLKNVL